MFVDLEAISLSNYNKPVNIPVTLSFSGFTQNNLSRNLFKNGTCDVKRCEVCFAKRFQSFLKFWWPNRHMQI